MLRTKSSLFRCFVIGLVLVLSMSTAVFAGTAYIFSDVEDYSQYAGVVKGVDLNPKDTTGSDISHISDEVFSGYEGLETTVSGKVGYNYALNTPDGKHSILYGFTPYNNTTYAIATGWTVKMPYLNINGDGKSFYQSDRGYTYMVNSKTQKIVDFPSEHKIVFINNGFVLEKPYGVKEYFSEEGFITKSIDEFGNITTFSYDNECISQITYFDGSFVAFEKTSDNTIHLNYSRDGSVDTIASFTFETNSSGFRELSAISDSQDDIKFTYVAQDNVLLLKSITNKDYVRTVLYETTPDIPRIKNSVTDYNDGVSINKYYFYDSQNRLEKLMDGDFAEVSYNYIQDNDGNLTTNTIKEYNGETQFFSETLNKFGQITKYTYDGNVLELKYNQFNKVSEEIENDMSIRYSYTNQGKVAQAVYSNGELFKYEYYPDGTKKKIISDTEEISYTPSGEVLEIRSSKMENTADSVDTSEADDVTPASSGVYVLYNINNEVGVTNFHTYYGLPQSGFNCYTFAIGKVHEVRHPGYYSGNPLDLYSLSGIKLNTEHDQRSLGRHIYDCTVNQSVPVHSWKMALRIRVGQDYHFMSMSGQPWKQKAGISGPVMYLLGGKNPNNVSWDTYRYNILTGKYVVFETGFYNSATHYMMIRD